MISYLLLAVYFSGMPVLHQVPEPASGVFEVEEVNIPLLESGYVESWVRLNVRGAPNIETTLYIRYMHKQQKIPSAGSFCYFRYHSQQIRGAGTSSSGDESHPANIVTYFDCRLRSESSLSEQGRMDRGP